MQGFVDPVELVKTRRRLERTNVENYAYCYKTAESGELARLLLTIKDINPDKLGELAWLIGGSDIEMLCAYIPRNRFKIEVWRVFAIILARLSVRRLGILYRSWQENYENHVCDELLRDIARRAENSWMLEAFNIKPEAMYRWASSPNAEIEVLQTIKELGMDIRGGLRYLGIGENTALARNCLLCRTVKCGAEEYLKLTDEQMKREILRLDQKYFLDFLHNFVAVLTVEQLEKYRLIAGMALRRLGGPSDQRCVKFFGANTELYGKYKGWMNRVCLSKTFDADDPRLEFWKRFADMCSCTCVEHVENTILVIDFGTYVALEMKHYAPLYFFGKSDFNQKIWDKFKNEGSEFALRRYLDTQSEVGCIRIKNGGDTREREAAILRAMQRCQSFFAGGDMRKYG